MSDGTHSTNKPMKETNRARQGFEDYYQMGPGRSIRKLIRTYNEVDTNNPPTKHHTTLAKWSKVHGWQERVRQRDQEITDAQMAHIKATATSTGYALFQQRIHDLGALAEKMYEGLTAGTKPQNYLAAVKEFRGLLTDIAAEMGDREKKHRIKVDDWRSEIIELLRDGTLTPEEVINELGRDLATELFVSAGIRINAGAGLLPQEQGRSNRRASVSAVWS